MQTYAILLAGGRGERLWPLSTHHRPKQFLTPFGSERPLLAQAVARLEGIVPAERIQVITAEALLPATRAAVPHLPPENLIGEPLARDTAAAVALACGLVARRDPEGILAILTADHVMGDEAAFRAILADAYRVAARHEAIVTLGVAPTFPSTDYGYLECAETLPFSEQTPFRAVRRFVEKPDRATAQAYLETGAFLWNAGMFIGHVAVMTEAFRTVAPCYLPLIDAPQNRTTLYPTLPKTSFDIAVMEHWQKTVAACGDFGWDDVGSLEALGNRLPVVDAQGNRATAPIATLDTHGCIVLNEKKDHLTALLGVEDLVVVETEKATLICPQARLSDLKSLVAQLPPNFR